MKSVSFIASLTLAAVLALPAAAHTPYLQPTTFEPDGDHVTVMTALTNGRFFVPEFPIKGDDFLVTDGAGKTIAGKGLTLRDLGVFEAALWGPGTYRISTGERNVRTLSLGQVGDTWRPVKDAKDGPVQPPFVDRATLPADARIVPVATIVRSETYVTKGAPSATIPPAVGKGLEVAPRTAPTSVFVNKGFDFDLLFDGKTMPDMAFTVFRANDAYAGKTFVLNGKTDAKGRGNVTFDGPGIYVLEAQHSWLLGDPADARTHLYSLTLEVTP
ncbi:DUF4198 domain-containing protein [Caulobacter segnis]|uniref:DUF4198 domain-containing protein n=1 Tax=Caulobacter segnis TaxID=88688 RepID=UPI00285D5E1A|nr:DUF4198 domain-containing protein [Caulobacter segnis]MDR6623849.1 hypothetical protein [Caulobacter segnis]